MASYENYAQSKATVVKNTMSNVLKFVFYLLGKKWFHQLLINHRIAKVI